MEKLFPQQSQVTACCQLVPSHELMAALKLTMLAKSLAFSIL
jgi:hypothetical protein